MSDKYVVPEGMLKAGMMARNAAFMGDESRVRDILEAAIRWLSENPIVPTEEQVQEMRRTRNKGSERRMHYMVEWQRRCFLAPEPEVPDAVKDLLKGEVLSNGGYEDEHNRAVLEAYRRGKAGK